MLESKNGRTAVSVILAFVFATLVWGCPQPIEGPPCGDDGGTHGDGGTTEGADDAGGDTDGGQTDGGDSGTEADGGSTDGGMDEVSRADAGAFSWAVVPGTGTGEVARGIHGNSPSNFYVATDTSRLLRSTGGAFTQVYAGTGSYVRDLFAVWVTPNGNVFAGGDGILLHCLNGTCAQQSDFVPTLTSSLTPSFGTIEAMCGSGDGQVYASGGGTSGRLWKFNFTAQAWEVAAADTGTFGNDGCWVAPSGEVFIAVGSGKILRVDTHGIPVVETVLQSPGGPDPSTGSFYDVVGAGNRVFAVGNYRRIAERNATTNPPSWTLMPVPTSDSSSSSFNAVVSTARDELLAAGSASSYYEMIRFDGASWSWVPDDAAPPFYISIHDGWAATPDLVYFAGSKGTASIVIRGQR